MASPPHTWGRCDVEAGGKPPWRRMAWWPVGQLVSVAGRSVVGRLAETRNRLFRLSVGIPEYRAGPPSRCTHGPELGRSRASEHLGRAGSAARLPPRRSGTAQRRGRCEQWTRAVLVCCVQRVLRAGEEGCLARRVSGQKGVWPGSVTSYASPSTVLMHPRSTRTPPSLP